MTFLYCVGDIPSVSSTGSDTAPTYETLSLAERKNLLKNVCIFVLIRTLKNFHVQYFIQKQIQTTLALDFDGLKRIVFF